MLGFLACGYMVSTGCSGSQAGDISYMAAGHHESRHGNYLAA